MLGVWIEPVTAQVMITLPWAAATYINLVQIASRDERRLAVRSIARK
jgi:hypothetical protein